MLQIKIGKECGQRDKKRHKIDRQKEIKNENGMQAKM